MGIGAEIERLFSNWRAALAAPRPTGWDYATPIDLALERRLDRYEAVEKANRTFRDALRREIIFPYLNQTALGFLSARAGEVSGHWNSSRMAGRALWPHVQTTPEYTMRTNSEVAYDGMCLVREGDNAAIFAGNINGREGVASFRGQRGRHGIEPAYPKEFSQSGHYIPVPRVTPESLEANLTALKDLDSPMRTGLNRGLQRAFSLALAGIPSGQQQ